MAISFDIKQTPCLLVNFPVPPVKPSPNRRIAGKNIIHNIIFGGYAKLAIKVNKDGVINRIPYNVNIMINAVFYVSLSGSSGHRSCNIGCSRMVNASVTD